MTNETFNSSLFQGYGGYTHVSVSMATTSEQHVNTNNIQLPEDALVRSVHGARWTFEQFDEIL